MIAASGSILTRRWVTTGLNLYEMITELKVKLNVIVFFFSGVNDKLFLWKILMVEYKIADIFFVDLSQFIALFIFSKTLCNLQ